MQKCLKCQKVVYIKNKPKQATKNDNDNSPNSVFVV